MRTPTPGRVCMLRLALAVAAVSALLLDTNSTNHQQLFAAAVSTVPMVHTDRHMGIRTYSFLIESQELNSTAYELRVFMRAVCEDGGKKAFIRGYAGAYPIEPSTPTGLSLFAPHFQPPSLHQHKLAIVSTASTPTATGAAGKAAAAANTTQKLNWMGPSSQGLWRFQGRVEPIGGELLTYEGSLHVHQLPLDCEGSMVALGPAQHTPLPAQGLWNVITTISDNNMDPETLAYLLTLHMSYHERLGFNGTILRCNKGEAQELSLLPHIESLVETGKLIIWPWVHEHSTGNTPFFWQKPRNQLTLLAAYGTNVRLAFFDLDEYLVLPQGGTLASAQCNGKPLLDDKSPAWSFARHSTRSCLDNKAPNSVDLVCWKDGQALPVSTDIGLELERCPCRFHKPLLRPERVLTMSVHYVWAFGKKIADVPQSCGFLVHLHALIKNRGHFMPAGLKAEFLVRAQWVLPEFGSGQVVMEPAGQQNIGAHLHNFIHCEQLRKAAGEREGKMFSLC